MKLFSQIVDISDMKLWKMHEFYHCFSRMNVTHFHDFEHLSSLELDLPSFISEYCRPNSKTIVLSAVTRIIQNDNCLLNQQLVLGGVSLNLFITLTFFHIGIVDTILLHRYCNRGQR